MLLLDDGRDSLTRICGRHPRGSRAGANLSAADLFDVLWEALADVLGTAIAATLLRRAAQRAAARWPELAAVSIRWESLQYRYTVPSPWKDPARDPPQALRELAGELWTILEGLTGSVVVDRLGSGAAGQEHSRAFEDIAQVLEWGEDSEARVIRVLEQLRSLVPYERCAVLQAQPGCTRRLVAAPGTPPADRAGLMATTAALLGVIVEDHERVEGAPSAPAGAHLAVPLVGKDQVVGVLFVLGAEGAYEERHARALAVVASKLAAYCTASRAHAVEEERWLRIDEARLAAEKANRAKDEFLAMVSHELRKPLRTIVARADALRSKDHSEADRREMFETIERTVRAQAKLIEDILDLSCVTTATRRLDLRAVEPARLIKAAIAAVRPRADQKSIRLDAVLDESITPLIADPHRLSQVVADLVANAIKVTPDGGRVEVCLERAGAMARIRVIDSGPEMGPEVAPSLIERFRQLGSPSTRSHGVLRIGQALVKDLVEIHGGRVRAERAGEKKGATVTVDLPLAAAGPEASTPRTGGRRDERALAGIRVLVVEADRDIREVLRSVLEARGAAVTVAVSSAEALAALEHWMPNVLLSDFAIPHEPALAPGLRMPVSKPVDPESLVAAVEALARRPVETAAELWGGPAGPEVEAFRDRPRRPN